MKIILDKAQLIRYRSDVDNNNLKQIGDIMNRIPQKAIRDALSVCGGLYRLNAKSSIGYAFCVNHSNNMVATGEFVFNGENPTKENFDGFIEFESETITDFIADKTYSI